MTSFSSWDGTRIFIRQWLPAQRATRAILILHRGHEHADRVAGLGSALVDPQTAVFAWDARGNGRSHAARPVRLQDLVRDLDACMAWLEREHGLRPEDLCVVAHSLAAVYATAWLQDHAPRLRGLVLLAPAFEVRLYVPLAIPLLRLLALVRPAAKVRSYVGGRLLTADLAEAAAYDRDPLIDRTVDVRLLLDLHDAGRRVVDDAAVIATPTLVLTAGRDVVVRREPQDRFASRLPHPRSAHHVMPDMRHDMLHDVGREEVARRIRDFVHSDLAQEDVPLRPVLPRRGGAGHALLRLLLRTLGRASAGIRVGLRHGFDSGEMMDYVYADRAQGANPLGRALDRCFLDAVGWRGIRQRRRHIQELLSHALDDLRGHDQPLRILDIASGAGRYVLDVLARHPDAEARCQDADPAALALGRERAAGANVRFATGDAFDEDALAAITPPPTVAIVSGLYELFPDNAPLRASLRGLAHLLPPGGWLVYTNQPRHPQLDLIANVLPNRLGRPWHMRCRPQAEMDALVREAGFDKLCTRADADGIFTVSLAQRSDAAPYTRLSTPFQAAVLR